MDSSTRRLIVFATVVFLFGIVQVTCLIIVKQDLTAPAVAKYANSTPASEEAYLKYQLEMGNYGKYEMVLNPSRQKWGQELAKVNWNLPQEEKFAKAIFDDDQIHVMFGCHRCYTSGDVSGGSIQYQKGAQKWKLSFHHVGAESVLYCDELPPTWVVDRAATIPQIEMAEQFLDGFAACYIATQAQDPLAEKQASLRIENLLLNALIRKLNSKFNRPLDLNS